MRWLAATGNKPHSPPVKFLEQVHLNHKAKLWTKQALREWRCVQSKLWVVQFPPVEMCHFLTPFTECGQICAGRFGGRLEMVVVIEILTVVGF
jgi:hypothetical protein